MQMEKLMDFVKRDMNNKTEWTIRWRMIEINWYIIGQDYDKLVNSEEMLER